MRKIVLLCAAGMSTSLLVTKIKKAAEDEKYDIDIAAYPIAQYQEACKNADLVLLGPQIRFELDRVKGSVTCPVEIIDIQSYGMMDGKAVVKQIKSIVG